MNYLRLFESFQDQLTGVYSTATLIIALIFILWLINFTVTIVTRIFSLGKTIGGFYRNYLHRYFRPLIFTTLNIIPGINTTKKVS